MKKELSDHLKNYLFTKGINQKELAEKAYVSQSTVSKGINQQWKNYSGNIEKLAQYTKFKKKKSDPTKSIILMDALSELWDGSKKNEKAIAEILKSVNNLS